MRKVAIYVRVSREDLNIDNQMLPCVAYCKSKGWNYEVFIEKESTRKQRPIQYKLWQEASFGKWDVIVVFRFDRWARNASELIGHMNDFRSKGVKFISISESIDPETSYGRAFFGFIAVMAEFEREIIRERTLAGLARAKALGKKLGRPQKSKEYKIPDSAKVKDLRDSGKSIREIAKILQTSKWRVEQALKKPP